MKLTKTSLAVAALVAVAGGSAFAGQIDSSSATLATEVIRLDAQQVRAPSKSYAFAGNIDARTNEQRLQLQYKLTAGKWNVAATGSIFTAANTLVALTGAAIGAGGLISVTYTDAGNIAQTSFPPGTVVNAFTNSTADTLVFNITIPGTPANANFLGAPNFVVNAGAYSATATAATALNVGLNNLFSVAGATACPATDKNININFKHFTNHFGNNTIITGDATTNPDSEHIRSGSTNDARLLNFTQNLVTTFTAAGAPSRLDAATLNSSFSILNFATTASSGVNAVPAAVFAPANALDATTKTTHYAGLVKLSRRSNGLDLNYVNQYGNTANGALSAAFIAADITAPATAVSWAGDIEMAKETIAITGNTAWPSGTKVYVYDATGTLLNTGGTSFTSGVASVDVTTAASLLLAANGAHVFVKFPGGVSNTITQQGSLATTNSWIKASDASTAGSTTAYFAEQNNVCSGVLTGVGGGIKIDVRNYATAATFGSAAAAPRTFVRIINNSESQAADIFAQIIYADGKYGPWGQLSSSLAPRAVLQMSNAQIEALLLNAAPSANPFGTGTVYTSDTATTIRSASGGSIGDRLRIVSNTGTTLRVQSYMLLNGLILDTSPAMGVDFENTANNRTPSNAVDAQPVEQDAINGLARN